MKWVEEDKRLEDYQLQDKAKAKVPAAEKKEVKAHQAPDLKWTFSLRLKSQDQRWLARCTKNRI